MEEGLHQRSTLHESLLPPLYSPFTPIHPCLLLSVILTCKAKPQTAKHISSDIPPPEISPWILFFIPLPWSSDLQQSTLPPQPGALTRWPSSHLQEKQHGESHVCHSAGCNLIPPPSLTVLVLWVQILTDTSLCRGPSADPLLSAHTASRGIS